MPSSYPHLAEALGRSISRLVAVLADRWEVDNHAPPYRSFDDILEESRICLEKTLEQDIVAALRRLGVMMESAAAHNRASSAGMREQVEEIDHTLTAYVAACGAILERPFPHQGEAGRILLAAILERPLRHNEFTVDGKIKHRLVDRSGPGLPEEPWNDEPIHARSVALSSEQLGITAKMDLVEGEGRISEAFLPRPH